MTEEEVRCLRGLSEDEVKKQRDRFGLNELPSSEPKSLLAIIAHVVTEPMILLLLVGGGVYFILGDTMEALVLLVFVFVVITIEFLQERKTERTLEALRDLSSPRALVIRDGVQTRIAGRDVVPEDLVILSEGDRVPADGYMLYANNVTIDESLLTGESVPVRKKAVVGDFQPTAPGGDDLPAVFSGTLVVQGQGVACISSTGRETRMGRIGSDLDEITSGRTPLQQETDSFVKKVATVGFCCCALVVILFGLTRHDWYGGLLAGIALAMAVLPEEFPVVMTIFLSLGAWRIAQRQVLTRNSPAIETLGTASVLCVDKTGTLTQNKMTIARICAGGKCYEVSQSPEAKLPEEVHPVIEFGILASQRDPFDPMEKAFTNLGENSLSNTEHLHTDWTLAREYPLSPEMLALSHAWVSPDGKGFVVAAKGAPEAIVDLCHLDTEARASVDKEVDELARAGLRVLAVARATAPEGTLPPEQHDFVFELLGLVGLADPIRASAPAAVSECLRAGLRVVMITGDYPQTALQIAEQIGLPHEGAVMTGPELEALDDEALSEKVSNLCVFARVVPEQKLRIVRAFQARNEIVAMTGDGVNDAPALKAADIGIAMGQRGTDVAREASDLVILDDDFSSIVAAVRMGRRIFDNLEKAMAYILSIHVPIAGVSLVPVILKWPLVLLPVHIAFLELIIDPACSIAFEAEPEEAEVMKRPPRPRDQPLFSRTLLGLSLTQGIVVLLITLTMFGIAHSRGHGETEARALTFVTLVVANIALILTNRSWTRTFLQILSTPNKAVWYVVVGALGFLSLALFTTYGRTLFRFGMLHGDDLAICFGAGVASVLWFELLKYFRPRRLMEN